MTKMRMALNTYWRYFWYVMSHKKNVFIESLKRGKIIHGITHDLSKFLPSEFFAYAEKFFAGDYAYKYFEVEEDFEAAWLRHQHRNKHHWDYWVKSDGYPVEMPRKYVIQMIIDWEAMGRKFGDTAKAYYMKKKAEIKLDSQTRKRVEKLLGIENA